MNKSMMTASVMTTMVKTKYKYPAQTPRDPCLHQPLMVIRLEGRTETNPAACGGKT
jgi:hypothetical protein